jgi:hypothetical protein
MQKKNPAVAGLWQRQIGVNRAREPYTGRRRRWLREDHALSQNYTAILAIPVRSGFAVLLWMLPNRYNVLAAAGL